MADAEEIIQLREMLAQRCRRLHDLLVRGTLIGWSDVPLQLIGDLAATRAEIEQTQARLREYEVAVTDCTRELVTLRPLGLMVSEPVLKEAEEFWTSNRYDAAVSVLRAAYATRRHDPTFIQRYLHYWYLLGIRAVILNQLPIAYHAVQEVVQLDPGYKHGSELLHDLERQLGGEPRPAPAAIALPAPSPRRVESRANARHPGRQGWFSAVPLRGWVVIGGIAAVIAVLLLTNLDQWVRPPIERGPVPAASVTTIAPVIAAASLPPTSTLALEDTRSSGTTLPTAGPTTAPAVTLLATPIVRPTASPTALPPPTPAECGTRRVGVPALYVRDAPLGTSLTKVYQGTQLTLLCEIQTVEVRQWVKIRVTADPTIVGWIRADYLEQL
jgi:hypothetical protein